MAFRHSMDWTQTILFVLLIAFGVVTSLLPREMRHFLPDASGWEMAAGVLGLIFLVRLLLAPYWLWKEQGAVLAKAKAALAALSVNPERIKASAIYARLKLMLGPDSALSPEARLKMAQTEFDRLANLADSGDDEAGHLAVCVAEWLRDSARFYYASSVTFHEIQDGILERLGRLEKRSGESAGHLAMIE
jgi:hypothetical protein